MPKSNINKFLKQAAYTAEHFGFKSYDAWRNKKECTDCKAAPLAGAKAEDRKLDGASGLLVNGINSYLSGKFHVIEGPIFYYSIERTPRTNEAVFVLQVFGVEKSIAEAVLIQTIRSLLTDIGFADHLIRINSLGDSDSQVRYVRELTNFFRKRIDDMPPTARDLMKEHVTSALINMIEKEHDLAYRSPSPMEYLSDSSRKHFREIVEFLDMSETPYEIDPKLIGHYNCFHDAFFSFDLLDGSGKIMAEQPLKIRGGRYSSMLNKYSKNNTPAAGAVISFNEKLLSRQPKIKPIKPSIHLVHLGFASKVRSLLLIDELRRADIAVEQNLASDSLSEQLRYAEETGARYTIIIGQKEYVENSVILRDMLEKNQETIPLKSLVTRLKRMKDNQS